jgi:hypothetical protein
MGLKLLQAEGFITAFITREHTKLVARRGERLGIPEIHQGVNDKLSRVLRGTCRLYRSGQTGRSLCMSVEGGRRGGSRGRGFDISSQGSSTVIQVTNTGVSCLEDRLEAIRPTLPRFSKTLPKSFR